MKKIITKIVVLMLIGYVSIGQNLKSQIGFTKKTGGEAEAVSHSVLQQPYLDNAKTLALWDVQFNYDANIASQNNGGQAGVVHIGNEFWLSKWGSDTLIRVANDGTFIEKFTISGVSAVRALTYDGEMIYAGQNTDVIAIIDPIGKTLEGSITVNSSVASAIAGVRHLTYVASADGGNGGFYVGNFNTAIYLISKDGANILQTIDAGTHQQTGMYGSAYDTLSPDGPHLWVFCQQTGQNIVQIDPSTGQPTGIRRNVLVDFGTSSTSAIAGGLFISPNAVAGFNTIGGILQGTPNRLFGYELDEFILPDYEANLVEYKPVDEYVVRPLFMNPNISFVGKVSNLGATPFDTIYLHSVLFDEDELDLEYNTDFITQIAYGDSAFLEGISNYNPTNVGVYTSTAEIKLWDGIMDETYFNDTASSKYIVTDTTYSRAYFDYTSSLGIGDGTGGLLGNKYNFSSQTKVSSVTFRLNNPTPGDSVFIQVNAFSGSNPNNTIIVRSDTYIIQEEDEDGVWITLPLRNGPRTFNAGNFLFSVREHANNATVATNAVNWRPNTSYVRIGTGSWRTTEFYNFQRAYLIAVNLVNPALSTPSFEIPSGISVYPNPANNVLMVEAESSSLLTVSNTLGQIVAKYSLIAGKNELNISMLPKGLYNYSIKSENGVYNNKLLITE
jgi:hypothetical protein